MSKLLDLQDAVSKMPSPSAILDLMKHERATAVERLIKNTVLEESRFIQSEIQTLDRYIDRLTIAIS